MTPAVPSSCSSHHVVDGAPAYEERFDDVQSFHPPGLAAVRRGGVAWHVHRDGTAAYARRFKRTFGYYQELAAVDGGDGWHHITPSGADAYPARFVWCGNFQHGRCTVRSTEGRYFHIIADGTRAYPQAWRYAGDYREGLAVVQAADGRCTHIDLAGAQTHGRWLIDLDVFHKGFARARDEAGWTHVDRAGHPVSTRRFAMVEPFYNGHARVETFEGERAVIDETGTTLVVLKRGDEQVGRR